MKSDDIAFGIAGVCFGLIAGWVIGSQQAAPRPVASAPQTAQADGPAAGGGSTRAAVLDETQVKALTSVAERDPKNPKPRIDLAKRALQTCRNIAAVEVASMAAWREAKLIYRLATKTK